MFRKIDVTDANAMEQLWLGGQQQLERYIQGIAEIQTSAPGTAQPHIAVLPADQPVVMQTQDILRASINREVD